MLKLIQLEINDWKNTTSKRLFLENSFDFKIKSIGVFKNTEILKKAIQIIVNKLKNIIDIYSSSSKLIKESNITISYSFDIILENEDIRLSTILEAAFPMKDDVRGPVATPFVFFLNIYYSPFFILYKY